MGQARAVEILELKGKVLLVEDDVTFGEWLEATLSARGLDCVLEKNLQAALERFRGSTFHAVITDIFLTPGSSVPEGLDLIKAIQPSGTPVIMMSSVANLAVAREAVNHGASFILEKPFRVEVILEALQTLWEQPKGLQALLDRFMDIHHLTPREREVVRLLVKGLANKEIASIEEITNRTIKAHLTSIFQKCGVSSRTELFNAIFPT
jgi:DNA-binding NarL/FixJ family response regulator